MYRRSSPPFLQKYPYITVACAVAGIVGLCELIVRIGGVQRGFGALFWLPVIWAPRVTGTRPGLFAAVLATCAFYYFFVPLAAPYSAYFFGLAMMLAVMAGVAVYLGSFAKVRYLVLLPPRYWNEEESGDYWKDCMRGEQRARMFSGELDTAREMFMLGWIVRDMIDKGRYGGVEVGFFHRLSLNLMSGLARSVPLLDDDAQDGDPKGGIVKAQR